MATAGFLTVTVTGGVPSATVVGTIQDGTYKIEVNVEADSGDITLSCVTPYGSTDDAGFQQTIPGNDTASNA